MDILIVVNSNSRTIQEKIDYISKNINILKVYLN